MKRYCGRVFSAHELAVIRELIAEDPTRTRADLSRLVGVGDLRASRLHPKGVAVSQEALQPLVNQLPIVVGELRAVLLGRDRVP